MLNPIDILQSKIDRGLVRFGVIGLGYVGLPLSVEVADHGFTTLGSGVNDGSVRDLNPGIVHIDDVDSGSFSRHPDPLRKNVRL